MTKKSETTTQFIIKTVSQIFNKKGYSGTSISDITTATGLTKGAIYGNFKNKEELALAAFNHNVSYTLYKLKLSHQNISSPIAKLYAITNFYREYFDLITDFGGCPILNVGIDAHSTNPILYQRTKEVITQLTNSIEKVITKGIQQKEIKPDIDANKYSGRIYAIIEGAVFTSMMMKDNKYLLDMMDHLDDMIKTKLSV